MPGRRGRCDRPGGGQSAGSTAAHGQHPVVGEITSPLPSRRTTRSVTMKSLQTPQNAIGAPVLTHAARSGCRGTRFWRRTEEGHVGGGPAKPAPSVVQTADLRRVFHHRRAQGHLVRRADGGAAVLAHGEDRGSVERGGYWSCRPTTGRRIEPLRVGSTKQGAGTGHELEDAGVLSGS